MLQYCVFRVIAEVLAFAKYCSFKPRLSCEGKNLRDATSICSKTKDVSGDLCLRRYSHSLLHSCFRKWLVLTFCLDKKWFSK